MSRLVVNIAAVSTVSTAPPAAGQWSATSQRRRASAAFVHLALVAILGLLWPASARAQATQEVEYYHLDALGSVRVVTDDIGQVIARHDFLPFGDPPSPTPLESWTIGVCFGEAREWNAQPSAKEKKLFTGQPPSPAPSRIGSVDAGFGGPSERDAETGLDYFGARRFTSATGFLYGQPIPGVSNMAALAPVI